MSDNRNNVFNYSYCAKQQDEIKRIREKYVPREEDKLERLRRLDASVVQKGTTYSLIVGIIGCLALGLGMACTMVWGGLLFIPGILIGLAGLAGVAVSYPIYQIVTRKERERIAPEIIRLTDELIK